MGHRSSLLAPLIAVILLLLPILYGGSYFALIDPYGSMGKRGSKHDFELVEENYRVGGAWAETIFFPLETLDRRIRHHAWRHPSGHYVH